MIAQPHPVAYTSTSGIHADSWVRPSHAVLKSIQMASKQVFEQGEVQGCGCDTCVEVPVHGTAQQILFCPPKSAEQTSAQPLALPVQS